MNAHRLIVSKAVVRYQGIELADGRIAAVEMETQPTGYAVIHEHAGEIEILSLHADEAEAIRRCKELGATIEEIQETDTLLREDEAGKAEGRGTLQ